MGDMPHDAGVQGGAVVEDLFRKIIANNSEVAVRANVDELKCEYVWDWENEFDSLAEAYEEQGRGEAERQALQEIIQEEGKNLSLDDYCDLQDRLADHYGLALT
jgi:hypothetical protein